MAHTCPFLALFAVLLVAAIARADPGTNVTTSWHIGPIDSFGYSSNEAEAYAQGQADARRDLTNGVVKLKTCGLPAPGYPEYARLFSEKCQVKLEPIGGCAVSAGLVKYQQGYNEISTAFIRQKYGTNIFTEISQAAQPKAPASKEHVVQAGDTLIKIARQYGVTLSALELANPGLDPRRLRIGQELKVPSSQ